MAESPWWMNGIVYEIYPRSFQDSNEDGVGDLQGIRQRLDYLTWLGVDAIWIAPIHPSPMADFGYDVSDYCGVDPLFGSLSDFDDLLRDAHASGLKVILDFVPNHTSDQHPWFKESRSSRLNPKRDWYIWHNGKSDGMPPNNWVSQFIGFGILVPLSWRSSAENEMDNRGRHTRPTSQCPSLPNPFTERHEFWPRIHIGGHTHQPNAPSK